MTDKNGNGGGGLRYERVEMIKAISNIGTSTLVILLLGAFVYLNHQSEENRSAAMQTLFHEISESSRERTALTKQMTATYEAHLMAMKERNAALDKRTEVWQDIGRTLKDINAKLKQ